MGKYTDEQIKNALECCSKGVYKDGCTLCPFFHENCTDDGKMLKSVLDFINRLEAENARLKEEIKTAECNAIISFAEALVITCSYQPITPERKKVVDVDTIISLVKDLTGKEMAGDGE